MKFKVGDRIQWEGDSEGIITSIISQNEYEIDWGKHGVIPYPRTTIEDKCTLIGRQNLWKGGVR